MHKCCRRNKALCSLENTGLLMIYFIYAHIVVYMYAYTHTHTSHTLQLTKTSLALGLFEAYNSLRQTGKRFVPSF